jgi:serine/threonine protein kinase
VFAAPELLLPAVAGVCEYTPAADVWALGVSLFELVFGHRPFDQGLVVQADATAQEYIRACNWADAVRHCLQHHFSTVLATVEAEREQVAAADPALAAVCDVILCCLTWSHYERPSAVVVLQRFLSAFGRPLLPQ